MQLTSTASHIIRQSWFHWTVIAAIVAAGLLAGLETNQAFASQHASWLTLLNQAVLAVFIAEAALKLVAMRWHYFRDGWNVFDFLVLLISLIPSGSQVAVVFRLARTIRLLRLISALPKLQLLVGALLKSLSSMGYVTLLLGLVFYIYAVAGTHLFAQADPLHFGSLGAGLLTLFQIITLDNWSDLFGKVAPQAPLTATIYFVSFILLGTMIMLNLFIGVITNSMAETHVELDEEKANPPHDLENSLHAIEQQIAAIRRNLQHNTAS